MAAFAVIYDVRQEEGEDREEYFEVFNSPDEAEKFFMDTFGDDETVHNARVVQILQTIKQQRRD